MHNEDGQRFVTSGPNTGTLLLHMKLILNVFPMKIWDMYFSKSGPNCFDFQLFY